MKKITRRLAITVLVVASVCSWQITMAQTPPSQNPPAAPSSQAQPNLKLEPADKPGMPHDKAGMKGQAMGMMDDATFLKKAYEGGLAEIELGRLAEEKASSDKVKSFGRQMVDDHTTANQMISVIFTGKGGTDPMANGTSGTGVDNNKNASGTGTGTGTGTGSGSIGTGTGTDTSSRVGTSETMDNQGNASNRSMNNDVNSSAMDNGSGVMIDPALKAQGASILSTELSDEHKALKEKLSALSGAAFDKAYMQEMVKGHTKMLNMVEAKANEKSDASAAASPAQDWAKQNVDTIRMHKEKAEKMLNNEMKGSKSKK